LGSPPPEILHPEHVVSAAIETLTLYGLISQQSQYARISKKKLIYPAARDTRLTTVPDMMLPSYLERQIVSGPTDTWTYIPSAGDAEVEGARTHGETRCSFTKESDGFHLILTYNPVGSIHRLCYISEPDVAKTLSDTLDRGSRYGHLYTHKTVEGCIPPMLMRAANLPTESQFNSAQLQAISSTLAYAQAQVKEWEILFENEKDSNRNPKGRNRRRILGRRVNYRITY
jgi:hypothetical protein